MPSEHPDRKACVNEFGVIDFAMNGSVSKLVVLHSLTTKTIRRLRIRTRGTKEFTKTPRGGLGAYPSISKVRFWLDDIKKTDKYSDDIVFLKKLHVTLSNRLKKSEQVVDSNTALV